MLCLVLLHLCLGFNYQQINVLYYFCGERGKHGNCKLFYCGTSMSEYALCK